MLFRSAVNDTCGHEAGDRVLKTFAGLLQGAARRADIICRIGGDEFAVILTETGLSNARKFAERVFNLLLKTGNIRASAGAASLPSGNLFGDADASLLEIKRSR